MTVKWLPSYAPVDEEFDNVSLLLYGDGTNGSTTIVDSSSSPKTVTAFGDAQISTVISDPFGNTTGVIAFDGNGDYLTISSSSALSFGSGDYTIEFWIRWTALPAAQGIIFGGPNNSLQIYYTSTLFFGSVANSVVVSNKVVGDFFIPWTPSLAVWYHFALTKASGSARLFIDGSQVGDTKASAINYTGENNFIGGDPGLVWYVNANIDDLRITKGVARYTQNFTPPTAPFPDLSPTTRLTA